MIIKICKVLYYSLALFFFFIKERIKKFKKLKFIEVDFSRFGGSSYFIEGLILLKKNKKIKEFENYFFFSSFKTCNKQLKIMALRILNVSKFNWFFIYLKKASIFWKKKEEIFQRPNWNLDYVIKNETDIDYSFSNYRFTESEIMKGKKLLQEFGLSKNDKWVCLHNRDDKYLSSEFKHADFTYHNHRDFKIENMAGAAEIFTKNNFYVFRMGKKQSEKFKCSNSNKKIIDYAYSNKRSDFLDMYLLGNCEFFLGGDSGTKTVALSFLKPCYGVNWTPLLLYNEPGFFMKFKSKLHPWLFMFKRIKCLELDKKLSLQEILKNKVLRSHNFNLIAKDNLIFEENSKKDIDNLANEIILERNGANIISQDDIKLQNEFWNIFFKVSGEKNVSDNFPKISPAFLRNNTDLLN